MSNEYSVIPALTMRTMKAYVEHHQPTGSFLQAVFSNDLKSALGIADDKNFPALRKIITWVMCVAPHKCQGSPKKYKEWIKEFNPGGRA